jgi:hypothetical protein
MSFNQSTMTPQSQSFSDSNGLVTRFSFLFMIVIAFIILLRVGISLVTQFFKPSDSPLLINGMVDAKQKRTIKQDPSQPGSVTIGRSDNAVDGIEFSWSVWIYINNLDYNNTQYRHIFHKGNVDLTKKYPDENTGVVGMNYPNNAPGLYIAPGASEGSNKLIVMMNTFDMINEEIEIPNIPVNKWINVILRCRNTFLDVYVNGTITRSIDLSGVPKQNYGDVFVALNGGFDGYISNLQYYNYALGTSAINKVIAKGPNLNMVASDSSAGLTQKNVKYLATRWFIDE